MIPLQQAIEVILKGLNVEKMMPPPEIEAIKEEQRKLEGRDE